MPNPLGENLVLAAATEQAPAGTAQRPEDRRTEFVAVQGGQDTTSAEALLVGAYLVMWAMLLGFVFLGWRRSLKLESRLESLEKALTRHESSSEKS